MLLPGLLLINVLVAMLQMLLLRWGVITETKSSGIIPAYLRNKQTYQVIIEIVLLAPLLEETAFRGLLQHNRWWLRLSLISLSYLITCRIFQLNFYLLTWYTASILLFSFLTLLLSGRQINAMIMFANRQSTRIILIWLSAILFSLWHYYNFDFSQAGILTVLISLLPFLINGLLLSYVAAKNGLAWSILMHLVNNAWPLLIWL